MRMQADFENYPPARRRPARAEIDRATGKLAEALLPVLDAAEAAYFQHPDEVGPLLNLLLGELRSRGSRALDLDGQPFDPESPTPSPTSRVTAARSSSPKCCAAATAGRARRCARPWCAPSIVPARPPCARRRRCRRRREPRLTAWLRSESGSRRTTTRCSASSETATAERHHQGLPQARARAAPRQEPGRPAAEERFKEVSAAYDVLGDEAKRKEYDEVRRLGPMASADGRGPGGAVGPAGSASTSATCGGGDLGDLLGQMFGRVVAVAGGGAPVPAGSARSAAPTSTPS